MYVCIYSISQKWVHPSQLYIFLRDNTIEIKLEYILEKWHFYLTKYWHFGHSFDMFT